MRSYMQKIDRHVCDKSFGNITTTLVKELIMVLFLCDLSLDRYPCASRGHGWKRMGRG
jgi:hypothetical protein